MDYIIIGLLAAVIILLILLLIKKPRVDTTATDKISERLIGIDATVANLSKDNSILRTELDDKLSRVQRNQSDDAEKLKISVQERLDKINEDTSKQLNEVTKSIGEGLDKVRQTTEQRLDAVRKTTDEKLTQMQGVVDEKLSKTLNERLDSNFKQISENLGELYKSLGELKNLSGGVTALNKTLSNVKTRGVWGEQQLKAILEQTMVPTQYDENVITKSGSNDRVEFAIKLPNKTNERGFVHLPIDSKFPTDIYDKIVSSSEACDQEALSVAIKELDARIKLEAKSISTKYIDVPNTTDFAVMFLPTEGLYAEVLRIPGLSEECQNKHHIFITGPTTVTAFLNSLRIGFANVELSEKSDRVLKVLEAFKTEYQKFEKQVDDTLRSLNAATNHAKRLQTRNRAIGRTMKDISVIPIEEADALTGMTGLEEFEDVE